MPTPGPESVPPRPRLAERLARSRARPPVPLAPWRDFVGACSWVLTLPLALVAALRWTLHDGAMWLIWLNAVTIYLYLPVYPVAVLAICIRRWRLAALAGCVVASHLWWSAPVFQPAQPLPPALRTAPKLRLFSTNLLMINPTPEGIVGELRAADPDVVLLQELSPTWVQAFEQSGVLTAYRYHVGVVRDDSFGTAIYAKRPLIDAEVWQVEGLPMTRATLDFDGRPLRLYNVHPLPPRTYRYTGIWRRQMAALTEALRHERRPLAAVGDFNATQQSAALERLLDLGLHSAHLARGRGRAVTFPNGRFPLPELRLDHALLSPELVCTRIVEGEGRGSDHKPLVVDVTLRR